MELDHECETPGIHSPSPLTRLRQEVQYDRFSHRRPRMIPRSAIRHAIDIQRILDRLVAAGGPLDAHPLQIDGNELRELEADLAHITLRWVERQGVKVE